MNIRHCLLLVLLAGFVGMFVWFSKQPRTADNVTRIDTNPQNDHSTRATDFEVRDDQTYSSDSTTSNQPPAKDLESLSLLLRTGTEEERKEAAARLSKLGSPEAVQILVTQLEAENPVSVRLALLAAVSDLTTEEALDELVTCCLGQAQKYDVREAARSSLTENATATSIDTILQAVRTRQDDQWFVRDAAKVFRGYSNPELVPHLRAGLLASELYVEAEMSAEALAKIGTPDAASALVSAALSLSDKRRTAVVSAIAHITGTDGLQRLAQIDIPDAADDVKRAITKAVTPSSTNP
jgi:HEAT repeat protein